MSETYRFECPEEHTQVERREASIHTMLEDHWYCCACRERYLEVLDKKTETWVTPFGVPET